MTREEAIKILNASDCFWFSPSKSVFEALNMAIDALCRIRTPKQEKRGK